MAWENHAWAWSLRGVLPSERLVLLLLVNAASENGYVEKYSIATMREKVPELKRRAIQKIIASLVAKGFIQERVRRSIIGKPGKGHTVLQHDKGLQISNGYQLDTKRLFPKDNPNHGPRLWKELITKFRKVLVAENPDWGAAIDDLMRPEYPSYFAVDEQTQRTKKDKRMIPIGLLCVHCESARASKFLKLNIVKLISIGETLSPPVHFYRFTHPKY